MNVYEIEQRFNRRTGKAEGTDKVWKERRCDFSGEVVADRDGDYPKYACLINLDYEDQDSCMGSGGEEYDLHKKHGIDVYAFLNEPYAIHEDAMKDFLKSAAKQGNLDYALRSARTATAKRLIEEGVIKPEQLVED